MAEQAAPSRSPPVKDEHSQSKQHGLQPLSCTHCRHRKVKCNRTHPCLPCQRSNLDCVFPERAKHPKKKRSGNKSSTEELLSRLSRMEQLLGSMEGDGKPESQETKQTVTSPTSQAETPSRKGSWNQDENTPGTSDHMNRYIGGFFWRSLSSEVEGLRQAMDDVSDGEDSTPLSDQSHADRPTPPSAMLGSAYNTPQNLRPLHPSPTHINLYFDIFTSNVDTVFKVLHVPTARNFITHVVANLDDIPTDNYVEPLMFAIYYSAVTTLTEEQCHQQFQESRGALLSKYRAGIERALTNADYLNTTELGTLQALGIFLVAVRCNDDSQFTWTMVATAVRLGHGMGLHRESNNVGLSPFAAEMRRRMWWQLIVLDIRCCEDRASEPIIMPMTFNTKRPLNINDDDIHPEMTEPPAPRIGYTQLSKCNVSHEVSYVKWRWGGSPTFNEAGEEVPSEVSYEERLDVLHNLETTLNENVLQHCNPAIPIQWVTSVVARLILNRIRLVVYHPIENSEGRVYRPNVPREKLLETAVAGMEFSHLLDVEEKAARWRWFFKTYVQWHALATTLAELCVQTRGPLVERAWAIVDAVFDDWAARIADSPNGMLWRPMKKLMTKATATRKQTEMLSENTDMPHQQPLPQFNQLSFQPQPQPQPQGMDPSLMDVPVVTPGLPMMNPPTTNSFGMGKSVLDDMQALPSDVMDQGIMTGIGGMGVENGVDMKTGKNGGQINWAEWDAFMNDFNMADLPREPDVLGMPPENQARLDVWW